MAFIETTSPKDASGDVRAMYERQQSHYGYVPNYAKVFSHRPELMRLWAELLSGIRRNLSKQRFELVTVAAALEIRSSYCSLAHGKTLATMYDPADMHAIVTGAERSPLSEAEKAMMTFARKIARNASTVEESDVQALKAHGLSDAEIFDIAAAASARTFFAQLCEGLGCAPDPEYADIDASLREALTVGRPIDHAPVEALV